jgi:hypothetical protein
MILGPRGARILAILVAFLIVAYAIGVGLIDDSYIFLRYARHVAEGIGPVFNSGERVEGYTSPLWLAVMVPLFALSSEPSRIAMGLCAAIGFGSVLLVASRRPSWNALLLATQPAFVFWSWSGMETVLAAFLLLGAFIALDQTFPNARPHWWMAGWCLALAILARPDCFVLVPLALLQAARTERTTSGRFHAIVRLALPFAVVVAHILWRHAYYGTWVPNTYFAKAGTDAASRVVSGSLYSLRAAALFAPLVLVYAMTTREYRSRVTAIVVVWSAAVIWEGGDFFPFARFFVPILPILAYGAGTVRLSDALGVARARLAATCGQSLLILASVLIPFTGPEVLLARQEVFLAEGWKATGLFLRGQAVDGLIATLVAGAIPYFSEAQAIDLLGLTDEHIARHGQVHAAAKIGHQRYDSSYVLSRRPVLIVLQDSGKNTTPRFASEGWPRYEEPHELRYVFAVSDLVARPEIKAAYEYRATRLPNGTFLEALWRKPSAELAMRGSDTPTKSSDLRGRPIRPNAKPSASSSGFHR